MWLIGDRSWFLGTRDSNDLEESTARWIGRQDSASWLQTAIVLAGLFVAIVLFAVGR